MNDQSIEFAREFGKGLMNIARTIAENVTTGSYAPEVGANRFRNLYHCRMKMIPEDSIEYMAFQTEAKKAWNYLNHRIGVEI